MKKLFVGLLSIYSFWVLFIHNKVNAQTPQVGQFTIATDQDYFFYKRKLNEDRNYTQGTSFTYTHRDLLKSFLFQPINLLSKIDEVGAAFASTFTVAGTAFTPQKIDSINPVIGDRPFAFLFYLSTSSTFVRKKDIGVHNRSIDIYKTFRINYGMLGTRLGYEFQSLAHRSIVTGRPIDPKGWSHQISNGGSPTILLEYDRFRPLPLWDLGAWGKNNDRTWFDLGWNFGGSVGYYDRVFSGLFTRIGYLKKENQAKWANSWGALGSGNRITQNKIKEGREVASLVMLGDEFLTPEKNNRFEAIEVFLFGRATSTLMLRNALLVGQRMKKSVYTLENDWTHTAIIDLEWGIGFSFEWVKSHNGEEQNKSVTVQYRNVHRSPEFNSHLDGFPPRWHYFGSLALSFPVR